MASFILHFTRAGTTRRSGMPAQARELLRLGLWGVPPRAQLRLKPRTGDSVLVAVGAPDRVFVGDGIVLEGYHRWSEDEAARFPRWLGYEHGLTLTDTRVWPRAVPVMSVWPGTEAARSNRNPDARWFGSITNLSSADAALIVASGVE